MFDVLMVHPDVGSDAVSSDVVLLAASPGVHRGLVDIRLSLYNNFLAEFKCSCLAVLEGSMFSEMQITCTDQVSSFTRAIAASSSSSSTKRLGRMNIDNSGSRQHCLPRMIIPVQK